MRQNHIRDAEEPTENSQLREVRVQAAQINQLYSQSQWGLIGALLSAVVLVVALWSVVSQARLIIWLVCYLCIQVVRYLFVASFHRASPSGKDAVSWGRWFALSTVASGLAWGSAGVFLFPVNSMAHQFLLALFLAGISAAAAVVYSATMQCFLPTVMAELLPISARYLYQGDEFSVIIGSVILVFAAVLSLTGRHMHLTLADSLRLRFERSELIESLEKARNGMELRVTERTSDLVRVNRTLQEEIERRKKVEEELTQSEEKYRLHFENASDVLYAYDSELRLLDVSPSVERILGYSPEQLVGKQLPEVAHLFAPEYLEKALQETGRILAGERVESSVYHFIAKDGQTVIAEISGAPLVRGGNIVGVASVARDITERTKAEAELRIKDSAISSSISGIAIADFSGIVTYVNPAALQMWGYGDAHEVVGRPATEFWESEDKAEDAYRVAAESGWWIGEMVAKRKDGSLPDLQVAITIVRDDTGRSIATMGSFLDISEAKRAQEELQRNERLLKTIFATSPIGISLAERRTLKWANETWERMFGFAHATEYIGQNARILFSSDEEFERAGEILYPGLKSGAITGADLKVKRKDGTLFDAQVRVRRLDPSDPSNQDVILATSDISDRKKAEEALRESEDTMRLLIESSPVGIGIVQDGKYAYVNPALVRMMGCTGPDGIVGQSPLAFIVPEDRDMVRQRGKQRLEGLDPAANYQVGGLKKTGERFEMSIWPTRFDYQGKPSLLSFVADVTQENKLKAQLLQAQKMEAVGILAGGVAHDFNNLLTVVQGYSELLLMDKDEKAPGYSDLQKIHEAGLRGAELVQNLLAFSRRADTKPRPINLNHEVVRIENLLNRTIPKMIKIDLHLDGGLAAINADSDRMGQVLMNLAVNAEHAMPDGGELTIASTNVSLGEEYCSSYPGTKPGNYVLLTVSDTGHGMDKETLEHIFEPFFTTKGVGKGTGLGLATVYGIIRQHGGHVTCCSEPGHGTTFKIYLPAITEAETEGGTEPEQVLPRGGAETILLVDDEDFIRDLGQTLLNRAGYTVITAASGPEAVRLYLREGERISLIILDLVMPEMGGDKCLEEILALNPNARILISSGAAVEGKTKETVVSGAKGFVSKPFLLREMLNRVREVLDSE